MMKRLVLAFSLLAAACVTAPPKPAPVVPPPPDRSVEFAITCTVVWNEETGRGFEHDPAGLAECLRRANAGETGEQIRASVHDGAEAVAYRAALARPFPAESGRLRTDGLVIRDDRGQAWQYRGFTDFLLFKRFLDGEDLHALLTERITVGANVLRVLGMCENIAHFAPGDYGDRYWTALDGFLDLVAAHGLRVEFVAFADAQILIPSVPAQRSHFVRVVAALAEHWNAIGELVNEAPKNGIDPDDFSRPVDVPTIWTAGSGLGDGMPHRPPWDGVMHHGARKDEWPRDAKGSVDLCCLGWDGFTPLGVWVIQDEPMGAAEVAVPGRRANVPQDFYDFGAVAGIYGPGATFHSDAGILSAALGPTQTACALAFFAGLSAVSPDTVNGRYTRGLLGDSPLEHDDLKALRTLCMTIDNTATCVRVRVQPGYPVTPRGGWSVASVDDRNTVVHLVR